MSRANGWKVWKRRTCDDVSEDELLDDLVLLNAWENSDIYGFTISDDGGPLDSMGGFWHTGDVGEPVARMVEYVNSGYMLSSLDFIRAYENCY